MVPTAGIHRHGYSSVAKLAVCFLSITACSELLGIDDARVDPSLVGGGRGGEGGSGGTGVPPVGDSGHEHDSPGFTDASGDTGTVSPLCKEYCDEMMTFCVDHVKQYMDVLQCQKMCAVFPEGSLTEDGNTAGCRSRYASKARYAAGTERDAYCRKAGPGSDGTCGAICDGFCALMMPTCSPEKFPLYSYPSSGDCLAACRALRDAPPYSVSDGELPDRNDAQCRLFHVASSVMDPDEHCEHAKGVTMCEGRVDGGD